VAAVAPVVRTTLYAVLGADDSASYGPKVGIAYLLDIKLVNWFA